MDNFLTSTTDRLSRNLLEAFELGLNCGTKEKYHTPEGVEKFKGQFEVICNLDSELKGDIDIINNFNCTSVDNFDREYKEVVREAKKNAGKAKDSDKYKNFCTQIEKIKAIELEAASQMNLMQNDDDFEMGEEDVLKMIDPFNKQRILHPIRNSKCNHIYEESAVRDAIKVNRKTRCPYMGCNNKMPIQEYDLVVDAILRKRIEDAQTQQELQRDQVSSSDDEDED